MLTDGTPDRPDSGTHGFLFADLRGYTRLVDSLGAVEASRLLDRYRVLTRDVVSHHGGAEIKVLQGSRSAVRLASSWSTSTAMRCCSGSSRMKRALPTSPPPSKHSNRSSTRSCGTDRRHTDEGVPSMWLWRHTVSNPHHRARGGAFGAHGPELSPTPALDEALTGDGERPSMARG